MELILAPMVLDAKEPIGSMGDDTPMAVLSKRYRGLHHFFRQQFSQVTNPPIDPLREYRVMSLKTRLGNLGNVYDQAPSQTKILQLQSPLVLTTDLLALKEHYGERATTIDCTYDAEGRLARSARCLAADPHGGGGRGARGQGAGDPGRPRRLRDQGTRADDPRDRRRTQPSGRGGAPKSFSSIVVCSGECLDVHYVAVLIGVGATLVNAYLAEAAVADRHSRGNCSRN